LKTSEALDRSRVAIARGEEPTPAAGR
jgi:hypothetical protein